MIGPLTYLDAALLAVCAISGLLAMYRGLTREVLSIISWVAAFAAVAYFILFHQKTAEQLAEQLHAPLKIAQGVIGGIIFLIVLIVVHMITARLSDSVLDSRVGLIDRILGFAFGVARGFILIVIPYMFYESFVPDARQQYPWVRESLSLPYIQSTGTTVRNVIVRVMPSVIQPPSGGQQG